MANQKSTCRKSGGMETVIEGERGRWGKKIVCSLLDVDCKYDTEKINKTRSRAHVTLSWTAV